MRIDPALHGFQNLVGFDIDFDETSTRQVIVTVMAWEVEPSGSANLDFP
jgi:hypothetical protein